MKESYGKGLATHAGPESCGAARKGGVEALTGVCAGRVLSRERNFLRGTEAVGESGRLRPAHRYREMRRDPARSEPPCTYGNTSRGNREMPCSPGAAGRVGKSTDARRRCTDKAGRTGARSTREVGEQDRATGGGKGPGQREPARAKRGCGCKAGQACKVRSSGYVKRQTKLGPSGSARSCIPSTTWIRCVWPT